MTRIRRIIMVYKEKLVVCLKTKDGKVIREQGEDIELPFGSEYSIYIKNLESRKAKVKMWIDGEDVLDGKSLLINPNDSAELEGFLTDTIAKNKFKFIEKTEEISDYRGDKPEDGLIRVEFWYEKMKPIVQDIYNNYHWNYYSQPISHPWTQPYAITSTSTLKNIDEQYQATSMEPSSCMRSVDTQSLSTQNCSLDSFNDNGITVKGSEINQQFNYGNIGVLEEQSHIIVLYLKGYKDNSEKVEKIVTVKDKLVCKTCGKSNKSDS
jgi:hypothetical protein